MIKHTKKEKIDKYIKIKNLYSSKDTTERKKGKLRKSKSFIFDK